MALTADQYQALIVAEVGDVDSVVDTQITTLWELYSSETDPHLHYLLTKRKAIDLLQGYVREQVDQADIGASVDLSQKHDKLQVMWKNVDSEIATFRVDAKVVTGSTRLPLTARLTATLGPVSDAIALRRP